VWGECEGECEGEWEGSGRGSGKGSVGGTVSRRGEIYFQPGGELATGEETSSPLPSYNLFYSDRSPRKQPLYQDTRYS